MTKLTKAQLAERDAITIALVAKYEEMQDAINDFNEAVEQAWGAVTKTVEVYNDELNGAREWASGIASELSDFIGNKSDKWQSSDKGQAVVTWQEEFENIDLADVSLDQPDVLDLDADNHAELIEQLPEEAYV